MCVTLVEGYLRAVDRSSNKLYIFLIQNITSQELIKKKINFYFVCFISF